MKKKPYLDKIDRLTLELEKIGYCTMLLDHLVAEAGGSLHADEVAMVEYLVARLAEHHAAATAAERALWPSGLAAQGLAVVSAPG